MAGHLKDDLLKMVFKILQNLSKNSGISSSQFFVFVFVLFCCFCLFFVFCFLRDDSSA